jgi:hypothetical protein
MMRRLALVLLTCLAGGLGARNHCPMDMEPAAHGDAHRCCGAAIAAQASACCHGDPAREDSATLAAPAAPVASLDVAAARPGVLALLEARPPSSPHILPAHGPPPTVLRI